MSKPIRMMFIGTCRVYDTATVLAGEPQVYARRSPHRFHTAAQALLFVQHMNGQRPYRADMMHLVSDYAAEQILAKGAARATQLDALEPLRKLWDSFEVFVIEISSRREAKAMLAGTAVTVNTFSARDQALYAAMVTEQASQEISVPPLEITVEIVPKRAVFSDMHAIKQAVGGRPIIWVSHMRPASDDPQYATVIQTRADLAQMLCANAALLGDHFIDPSETAAVMGQRSFFQKAGTDLDHLTPAAAAAMAEVYSQMALLIARKT